MELEVLVAPFVSKSYKLLSIVDRFENKVLKCSLTLNVYVNGLEMYNV